MIGLPFFILGLWVKYFDLILTPWIFKLHFHFYEKYNFVNSLVHVALFTIVETINQLFYSWNPQCHQAEYVLSLSLPVRFQRRIGEADTSIQTFLAWYATWLLISIRWWNEGCGGGSAGMLLRKATTSAIDSSMSWSISSESSRSGGGRKNKESAINVWTHWKNNKAATSIPAVSCGLNSTVRIKLVYTSRNTIPSVHKKVISKFI